MDSKKNLNKKLLQKNRDNEVSVSPAFFEKEILLKILDTLPVMICLLTPDYYIKYSNKAFRNKFGETNGRHCYECCFGQDKPCDFCQSYDVLKTGKSKFWQCKSPDGSNIIDAYDYPFTDSDGSPLILEMDLDITFKQKEIADIKKIAKQIELEKNRYLDILNSMSDGVYIINKDYIIEYLNPSMKKTFGPVRNRKCFQYLHNFKNPCPCCNNEKVFKGETIKWVHNFKEMDKIYELTDIPIKNVDGTTSKLEIFHDITEKIKVEKLKKKAAQHRIENLEKKKIARELHDTVSQILFSSNLLSESLEKSWKNADPQKTLDILKMIRNLNNSALAEMRTILYENMPKNIKDQNLEELIKSLALLLTSNSDIEVDMINEGAQKYDYKVKQQVYRIAQEAINNIMKHSKANKINIILKQEINGLSLVVSDNGIGFDLKDRSFRKSFSLNIMKSRAREIGALLTVKSYPGNGTTISFCRNKIE
jgi:signal transduction histidine kinase